MKRPTTRRNAALKLDPLPIALEKLSVEEALKEKARRYIECNWSGLRAREDFQEAFANLAVCHSLLAPLHPGYRACLDLLRKSLQSYEKMTMRWRKEWFESDVQTIVGEFFVGLRAALHEIAANSEARSMVDRLLNEHEALFRQQLKGPPRG